MAKRNKFMFFSFLFFYEGGVKKITNQTSVNPKPTRTFAMECLLIQAAELMNNAVESVMCTAEQLLMKVVVPMTGLTGCVHRRRNLACVKVPGFVTGSVPVSSEYYLSLPLPDDADETNAPAEWHSLDTAFLDAHLRALEAQGEDTTERRLWLERDRLADYATELEDSATYAESAPSSPSVPLLTMPLLNDMDEAVTPVVPTVSPVVPGAPLAPVHVHVHVPVCPGESVRPLKRTCLLTKFAQAEESLLGKRRRRAASASAVEGERKIRAKRPTKMPARYNDYL